MTPMPGPTSGSAPPRRTSRRVPSPPFAGPSRSARAGNSGAGVSSTLARGKAAGAAWAIFGPEMTADRLRSNLSHRLALAPNDVDLHMRFARVLVETSDVEGARHEYRTILRLQPTHPTARRELARLAPAAGPARSPQP